MRSRRTTFHALALTMVWLVLVSPSFARDDGFKVIVHPENPVTAVDRSFLRDVFLRKETEWNHGVTIRPIDLDAGLSARTLFSEAVLKRSLAQLRSYWTQQIFSGKGVPLPRVTSPEAAIAYVLTHRGAVAYLPAHVDPGGAKVIAIR